jgi:uncharacterized protein with NRDE domain
MCLLLLAFQTHDSYPLIIAANRDEYHSRPAAEAKFWDDDPSILAGRDLQAGGTWLGITQQGRIAAVTNFHEDILNPLPPGSRGALVTGFLRSGASPQDHSDHIIRNGRNYRGFTLLFGTLDTMLCCSNRTDLCEHVDPGIHGLGNYTLNDNSRKVVHGKDLLKKIISNPEGITSDSLFSLLGNKTSADEPDSLDSSVFIIGRKFGTRCSTVIMIDRKGTILFSEKSFSSEGSEIKRVDHEFTID